MTGRVWRHVQTGRHSYELTSTASDGSDRRNEGFVEFPSWTLRPSTRVREIVVLMARAHGDVVDDRVVNLPGIDVPDVTDWQQLGWTDAEQYARFLDDLEQIRHRWRDIPDTVERQLLAYVAEQKRTAQIPAKGPFTLDQLVELHSIMTRAEGVVAQDLATEGTAA